MKAMRFHPPGFGGEVGAGEVKRDGWHEQGVLAVAVDDERSPGRSASSSASSATSSTAGVRRPADA